jgi:hypothetical protein
MSILAGPGTGIAPFRAFLQERMATKAKGPVRLIFGHQRRDTDFSYEDELSGFMAAGTLTKLSLAWSRESESKVYVQDKMREKRPNRGHGSAKAPFLCLRRCQAHGGRCRGGARSCLRGAWKKGCGRCPRVPEGTPRKTPVSDGGLLMNAHAAGLSVRTSCPYCGVGCGVVATADVAGGAAIAGDKSHPANFGRLCSKGSTLDETLALETRLLHPRVDGVRATWDGGPRSHHSRI